MPEFSEADVNRDAGGKFANKSSGAGDVEVSDDESEAVEVARDHGGRYDLEGYLAEHPALDEAYINADNGSSANVYASVSASDPDLGVDAADLTTHPQIVQQVLGETYDTAYNPRSNTIGFSRRAGYGDSVADAASCLESDEGIRQFETDVENGVFGDRLRDSIAIETSRTPPPLVAAGQGAIEPSRGDQVEYNVDGASVLVANDGFEYTTTVRLRVEVAGEHETADIEGMMQRDFGADHVTREASGALDVHYVENEDYADDAPGAAQRLLGSERIRDLAALSPAERGERVAAYAREYATASDSARATWGGGDFPEDSWRSHFNNSDPSQAHSYARQWVEGYKGRFSASNESDVALAIRYEGYEASFGRRD